MLCAMSVTIRSGRPEDAPGVARVHCDSWRATYGGIVPQSYLDSMAPADTVERWCSCMTGERPGVHLLVAEEAGQIVGFETYGPARPPDFGYAGELYAAYLLPRAQGRGLGTAMLAQVGEGLAAQGLNDMIVWVMEDNARGRRFYGGAARGQPIEGSRQAFEIAGREIWELAYGFRPLPGRATTG